MIAQTIVELPTPALLIDKTILTQNINRMQQVADKSGVRLRPHIKTHKIPEIAHRQLAAGAIGVAVAKLGEAEVMADAGLQDIQIANQIVGPEKVRRLRALAERVTITCAVDDLYQVAELSKAFESAPVDLGVFVEIDSGLGRCGTRTDAKALEVAQAIREAAGLRMAGIMTHAGQAYGARSIEDLARIGTEEGTRMVELADVLRKNGFEVPEISVGSTPTAPYCSAVKGVTELRAGNYVFHDRIQIALGSASLSQCSLSVLATVISRPDDDTAVLDAGSKSLAREPGAHGRDSVVGFGQITGTNLTVTRLSEEHGVVAARNDLRIGQRVRILPNHACPVTNLFDRAYAIESVHVLEEWAVAARGCVA